MSTTNYVKHVCDRCGNTVDKATENRQWYPSDWQNMRLGQTGAYLDLCDECNESLYEFLKAKNAHGMREACFNEREVI